MNIAKKGQHTNLKRNKTPVNVLNTIDVQILKCLAFISSDKASIADCFSNLIGSIYGKEGQGLHSAE